MTYDTSVAALTQLLPLAVAAAIISSTTKKIRSGNATRDIAPFYLTAFIATVAICFGPAVQQLLLETLYSRLPGQYARGLVYEIDFHPYDIIDIIINGFLTGSNFTSGAVVALGLWLIKDRKSPISAMIVVALVLMLNDFFLYTENAIFLMDRSPGIDQSVHYFEDFLIGNFRGLAASLTCDAFGGVFIGLICFLTFKRTKSLADAIGVRTAFREMSLTISKASGFGTVILIIFYFIFIWPQPETISGSLKGIRQLDIHYAGMNLWAMPTSQVSIMGTPALQVELPDSQAGVLVSQITGCDSDNDAVRAAEKSPSKAYKLTGHIVSIRIPTISSIEILGYDGSNQDLLTVQDGTEAIGNVFFPGRMQTTILGPATLQIPAVRETVLVHEETLDQAVTINEMKDGRDYALLPNESKADFEGCLPVKLQERRNNLRIFEGLKDELFVSPFGPSVIITLPQVFNLPTFWLYSGDSLDLPSDFPSANSTSVLTKLDSLSNWPAGFVNEIAANTDNGNVTVGNESYSNISTFYAGGNRLEVLHGKGDELTLTGTSNYVVTNDERVTNSLYLHLPTSLQGAMPPILAAILLWLQPSLRVKLIRFFKGPLE